MDKATAEAGCQDRLGCSLVRSGDLTGALRAFKKALEIKQRKDPDSPTVAKTLSNIAAVYSGKGEHEKALGILDDCLTIRETHNPGSLKLAKTLSNIAVVLSHLERYATAIKYHEKAFKIKQLQAPGSISMATTCVSLANLYITADPSKAVSYLKRAKLIAETSRPVSYGVMCDVFTVTGHILRHADFFDDAIDMYEKAISFERNIRAESPKISALQIEIENTRADAQNVDTTKRSDDSITESAKSLRDLKPHPELPLPVENAAPPLATVPSASALEHTLNFASSLVPAELRNAASDFHCGGAAFSYHPSDGSQVMLLPDNNAALVHDTTEASGISRTRSQEQQSCSEFPSTATASSSIQHSLPKEVRSLSALSQDVDDRNPAEIRVALSSNTDNATAFRDRATSDADTLDLLVAMSDGRDHEDIESTVSLMEYFERTWESKRKKKTRKKDTRNSAPSSASLSSSTLQKALSMSAMEDEDCSNLKANDNDLTSERQEVYSMYTIYPYLSKNVTASSTASEEPPLPALHTAHSFSAYEEQQHERQQSHRSKKKNRLHLWGSKPSHIGPVTQSVYHPCPDSEIRMEV